VSPGNAGFHIMPPSPQQSTRPAEAP
jgi:hypothetical protein